MRDGIGMEPSQKMLRRKANGYAVCVSVPSLGLREGYTPKDSAEEAMMDLCSEIRDSINGNSHTFGGYLVLGHIEKGVLREMKLPKLSVVDSIFDNPLQDTGDVPDNVKTKNAIVAEVNAGIMKPEKAVRLLYGDVADTLEAGDYEMIKHEIAKDSPYYVASSKVRELLYKRSLMAKGYPESTAIAMAKADRPRFKKEKDEDEERMKAIKNQDREYASQYTDRKLYSVWDWECYQDVSIGGNPIVFWSKAEAESFMALVKAGKIQVDKRTPYTSKDEWEATHTRDDRSIVERMNEDDFASVRGYRR